MKEAASKSNGKARRATMAVRRGIYNATPRSLQQAVYLMSEDNETAALAVRRLNAIFAGQNLIFRWLRTEEQPQGMLLIRNHAVGVWVNSAAFSHSVRAAKFPDFNADSFVSLSPSDALVVLRQQLLLDSSARLNVPSGNLRICAVLDKPVRPGLFQVYRG